MRSVTAAMKAHLAGDVLTVCTLWRVQRKSDGMMFGFTDHDQPVRYGGEDYASMGGYDASAVSMSSDLSTNNMEVTALFDSGAVKRADVEGGLWNGSALTVMLVNYGDLSPTMGAVSLASGTLGQFVLMNAKYVAEVRGLTQALQQDQGQLYSATCRATLGDSRCTIALGPLTYSGTVASVPDRMSVADAGLTQVGPTVPFVDSLGHKIPTTGPYTVTVVPPTGGSWQSNASVVGQDGTTWTDISPSAPSAANQYSVSGGVYTFWSMQPGVQVRINYNYAVGYFAYGKITFTSGFNSGYSLEVKTSSVGSLRFLLPPPFKVQAGDTYTVSAGCDRTFGTCKARFNNVVHFRGEPYVPGQDRIFRSQGD